MKIIGKMIVRHQQSKIYLARTKERLYRISLRHYKIARIGMDIGYLLDH